MSAKTKEEIEEIVIRLRQEALSLGITRDHLDQYISDLISDVAERAIRDYIESLLNNYSVEDLKNAYLFNKTIKIDKKPKLNIVKKDNAKDVH